MYQVTDQIAVAPWELVETFIRSPGPGGQNVNKVASAVQLRFSVDGSPALNPKADERAGDETGRSGAAEARADPRAVWAAGVRARLKRLAGSRLTKEGVIVIEASRFRSQEQNREDARERLFELIRKASVVPKRRRPTRPTRASKERRLKEKKVRGTVKALRRERPRGGAED
jgi:ribosome-associated protein